MWSGTLRSRPTIPSGSSRDESTPTTSLRMQRTYRRACGRDSHQQIPKRLERAYLHDCSLAMARRMRKQQEQMERWVGDGARKMLGVGVGVGFRRL